MVNVLPGSHAGIQEPTSNFSFDSSAAGLLLSFLSSSGLHDLFRLLVLGLIVDGLRQHIRSCFERFFGMFYVEIVSFDGDSSYSSCLS